MFDNFYDSVTLKRCTGVDKTKSPTYGNAETVSCRICKSEIKTYTDSDKVITKKTRKYHVPLDSLVKEKDLIDNYTVVDVKEGRGVEGVSHFLIVLGES